MATTLEVTRDLLSGEAQLAIWNDRAGTRLAGPKFNGSSQPIATFLVTPEMARELIAECQKVLDAGEAS